jgi:hypothetical protein
MTVPRLRSKKVVNQPHTPVEINEIKQYRKARCITSIEAVYRLYRFPMFSMSPPVLQMQVHLPGMHMVPFNDDDDLEDVLQRAKSQRY